MVYHVVLLRHGESQWNNLQLFTGTDVDLTEQGRLQAKRAGNLLKAHSVALDLAFTSVLKRAIRTLSISLDEMDLLHLPDVKSWRLNERHYGALQGLNKKDTATKNGEEQVHIWRRSYDVRPPALPEDDPRHPKHDTRYSSEYLPATESLEDCVARTLPFWTDSIVPAIKAGKRVIVAAHGNSLRGIVKHLDNLTDQEIMGVEIPVGTPLVYELDENTLQPKRHYYLGEPQVIGNKELLVGASSWGLMTPAGPGLSAWLRDLAGVGLIQSSGVLQVGADDANNQAGASPTKAPATKQDGIDIVCADDITRMLETCRFIAIDVSSLTSDDSLKRVLAPLKAHLDPSRHTLLLVTQQPPHHAPGIAIPPGAPIHGVSSGAGDRNPVDALAEELSKELESHGMLEGSKAFFVTLAPPQPTPEEVSLQAAKEAVAEGGDLNSGAAAAAPAGPDGGAARTKSGALAHAHDAATVRPLSAHSADDVRRVVLMLQYCGRPVSAPVLISAPHV